jgi:hypothetical protein
MAMGPLFMADARPPRYDANPHAWVISGTITLRVPAELSKVFGTDVALAKLVHSTAPKSSPTPCEAKRSPTPSPPILAFDSYPHILKSILVHAPFGSLLALRAASRSLQNHIDATLVRHLVIYPEAGTRSLGVYFKRGYHRFPRTDLLKHRALLDAVRIVDLPPPPAALDPNSTDQWGWLVATEPTGEAEEHEVDDEPCYNYGVVLGKRCTSCDRFSQHPAPFLEALAPELHHVEIVRLWNAHSPSHGIKTEVNINFVADAIKTGSCRGVLKPSVYRELWVSPGPNFSTILQIDTPPDKPVASGPVSVGVRFGSPEGFADNWDRYDRLISKCMSDRYGLAVVLPPNFAVGCWLSDALGITEHPASKKLVATEATILGEDRYGEWLGVPAAMVEQSALPLLAQAGVIGGSGERSGGRGGTECRSGPGRIAH